MKPGTLLQIAICLLSAHFRAVALAQTPNADSHPTHASFEVAVIRRSTPDDPDQGLRIRGRRISFENQRITDLVALAYDIHSTQIFNAPEWFRGERWNIEGTVEGGYQPSLPQLIEMLRLLLEERFSLKVHSEKREMKVYTIVAMKSGPKLTATKSSPDALPDQSARTDASQVDLKMTNYSMTDLDRSLKFFLERPVLDRTGLQGKYDMELRWTREDTSSTEAQTLPGLQTAMQEQLGLKIEATQTAAEALVIDSAAKPGAN
ncbi:MAG: TIGR03435 family protein [Janthinobacterium lividum]